MSDHTNVVQAQAPKPGSGLSMAERLAARYQRGRGRGRRGRGRAASPGRGAASGYALSLQHSLAEWFWLRITWGGTKDSILPDKRDLQTLSHHQIYLQVVAV